MGAKIDGEKRVQERHADQRPEGEAGGGLHWFPRHLRRAPWRGRFLRLGWIVGGRRLERESVVIVHIRRGVCLERGCFRRGVGGEDVSAADAAVGGVGAELRPRWQSVPRAAAGTRDRRRAGMLRDEARNANGEEYGDSSAYGDRQRVSLARRPRRAVSGQWSAGVGLPRACGGVPSVPPPKGQSPDTPLYTPRSQLRRAVPTSAFASWYSDGSFTSLPSVPSPRSSFSATSLRSFSAVSRLPRTRVA